MRSRWILANGLVVRLTGALEMICLALLRWQTLQGGIGYRSFGTSSTPLALPARRWIASIRKWPIRLCQSLTDAFDGGFGR
jgi:hypothetical protein